MVCQSCEIATICITDAGLRVQTAAVLMSQMQSEMVAQELIGSPQYFLHTALLSPLVSPRDLKNDKRFKNYETSQQGERQGCFIRRSFSETFL